MNLFTEQLGDLAEVHTPRFKFHCLECPALGLMDPGDPHFETGHPEIDVDNVRVRCSGTMCLQCLKMPASQDDDEAPKDAVRESAPKKTSDYLSQTEDDNYSEDGSFAFDN